MVIAAAAASSAATSNDDRTAVLRRARVWTPIDTSALDLTKGPSDSGSFSPGQTVTCKYSALPLGGNSPKFACELGKHDTVKIKYGGDNGEVFAEVAATRLLWALGFGSDRFTPVRVACDGCPDWIAGIRGSGRTLIVTPAALERRFPGHEPHGIRNEWAWSDLETVSEADGGASRAQRDALKLLAVFMQHTDNKPEQQRIVCLDGRKHSCEQPLMYLHDVGMTFGRASRMNTDTVSGANLAAWSEVPVWRGATGCIGNLPKSLTGTLDNPPITEAGRAFLAERLALLTDNQLRDMFTVARFNLRPRDPRDPKSAMASIQEWVDVFKRKRAEIETRRCVSSSPAHTTSNQN